MFRRILLSSFIIFLLQPVFSCLADDINPIESFHETAVQGFTNKSLGEDKSKEAAETVLGGSGVLFDFASGIGKVIGVGLSLLGTIFFVLMIYAGFLWMTSRGNEQQAEKAKNLIEAAVIGLIIIVMAYVLVFSLSGSLYSAF